jgi:flagellar biosynthesis protein
MKKRKLASAIGYKSGDFAPVLLAAGRGREAEQIIAVAQKSGIAVVEDEALAVLLDTSATACCAKPGDFIPPWCWEAAAKILAFVIKTDNHS